MSSPGEPAARSGAAAAVEMLGALDDPDVEQLLAGLGNAPAEWSGHPLEPQLLDRIDGAALAGAVAHAGAAAMIRRLDALIGQSDAIGLFGRQAGGRRMPVLAVQAGLGPARLIALAGPRSDGQPGLEVVVAGTVAAPVETSPVNGVHLVVGGNAPAPFTVTMPAAGPHCPRRWCAERAAARRGRSRSTTSRPTAGARHPARKRARGAGVARSIVASRLAGGTTGDGGAGSPAVRGPAPARRAAA